MRAKLTISVAKCETVALSLGAELRKRLINCAQRKRTAATTARVAARLQDDEVFAGGLDRSWMQAPPELRSITPDQLKDGQTLSSWEAYAACGPAASVAFVGSRTAFAGRRPEFAFRN